ncbi:MAG: hypothetical protein IJ565_03775 [Bacilli bacterium]|nr:hypothetical protein [Bacilli bacterium]
MNTYNINDQNFINSSLYKEFITENPSNGYLRIRAYAANQAIPMSNVKIVISTEYKNNNIIFFEGYTDSSGVIEKVSLPTPALDQNDLDIPSSTTYDVNVTYAPDNIDQVYKVNMYEDICVVQNISIVPNTGIEGGL